MSGESLEPLLRASIKNVKKQKQAALRATSSAAASNTQCNRVLAKLREYAPNFCPLPDLMDLRIAALSKRISELRRDGWIIELRDEWTGRERHTAYRLHGRLTDQKETQICATQ